MASNHPQTPPRTIATAEVPAAPKKKPVPRKAAALGNVQRELTYDGAQAYVLEGKHCASWPLMTYKSFDEAYAALAALLLEKGGSLKHATAAACAADFCDEATSSIGYNFRCWEVGFSAGWPTISGSGNAVIKCYFD